MGFGMLTSTGRKPSTARKSSELGGNTVILSHDYR